LSCPNRRAGDYNQFHSHGLWTEPLVDQTIKFMVCTNTLLYGFPALYPFVKPTLRQSNPTAKFPDTMPAVDNQKARV
jgi:hypothetical protein